MRKAYPKYKSSGVEWLGDVPEHWAIVRSDSFLEYDKNQIGTETFAGKEVFHYSIPAVQELGCGMLENGDEIASSKQRIFRSLVLVSKLNPRKATICIAEPKDVLTIASTEFVGLIAKKIHQQFLFHLVSSEGFRQRLDSMVQSVTRSHQRANPEQIYKFWTAFPPLPEQQAIAAYLDRETRRIDALIAKKQRLLELLAEQRKALISRAVTKGLNASVKLKPSGVKWLGDVPEHWEVKKLKWTYQGIGSGDGISPDDIEPIGTYPVYGGNGIMGYTEKYNSTGEDIIIGRVGAKCGNVYLVNGFKWISDNALRLKINKVEKRYLSLVLEKRDLNQLANHNAQPLITGSMVGNQFIPLPPLPEQQAISVFLDRETAKIDDLSDKVTTVIEKLKEYRTALISSAVTGKIDVREAV